MPVTEGSIVVGVDGSEGSDLALEWALDEAGVRNAPVHLVCTYRPVLPYRWEGLYVNAPGAELVQIQQSAQQVANNALARATERAPDREITSEATEGIAAQILVGESDRAALIVIGSRNLKALGSTLLGSVGATTAAKAACPVVVVRGPAGSSAEGAGVIVGIDGTEAAEPALAYGFEHASRHRVPLRAVMCWRPDPLATMQWRPEAPVPEHAEAWLSEALAGWREQYPDVRARGAVVRNHPVAGLVAESNAQHLLVVRSRTRHALAGTLLGSVSQGVLHHANCPVAVIPAASD